MSGTPENRGGAFHWLSPGSSLVYLIPMSKMRQMKVIGRSLFLGLFCFLGLLHVPHEVKGFNLLAPTEEAPVRWLESEIPVFLDVRGVPNIPLEDVERAVLNALTTWNAVPCSDLSFRYVGLVSESAATGVYIHWAFPGEEGGVLALDAAGVTETYFGFSGTIERADMHLNQQFSWTLAGDSFDPTRVDVEAVIVHELGHAIGLGHSRDREATMFFAGGDTSLRTLGQDDENGVCYLYPSAERPQGAQCDPCQGSDGCESDRCVSFPEGQGAYCLEACSGAVDDCSGGYSCNWLPSMSEYICLPNNLNCGEDSRGGEAGDYCYGGETCESGQCLPTPRGAYCTQFCSLDLGEGCPESMACKSALSENCPPGTKDCGLCVKLGDKSIGELCWDALDCGSGICLGLPGEPGWCTTPCTNGGKECGTDGLCALGICATSGDLPDGSPCTSPFECEGGVCAPLPTATGESSICSRICQGFADCSSNTTCADFSLGIPCSMDSPCASGECDPETLLCSCERDEDCLGGLQCMTSPAGKSFCGGSLCVPFPKKGRKGESCNEQAGCVGELNCDWRGEIWGVCGLPCDLQGDPSLGCEGEGECAWLPAPSAFSGACLERSATGRSVGETCSLENPCHRDLACVDLGEASPRCVEDCHVTGDLACPFPEACVDLGEGVYPERGVCLPEGFSPPKLVERSLVTGPPPPVNYGEPGGMTSSGSDFHLLELKPRVEAEGCQGAGGNFNWGIVFSVFCLMVTNRVNHGCEEKT